VPCTITHSFFTTTHTVLNGVLGKLRSLNFTMGPTYLHPYDTVHMGVHGLQ